MGLDASRNPPRFGAVPNVRAVRSRYVGCVGQCSTLRRCAIAVSRLRCLLPFRALVPLFAKTRTVTCAHPERLRYFADETWGSCQKSGGFHQMSALWVALWEAVREWEMENRR